MKDKEPKIEEIESSHTRWICHTHLHSSVSPSVSRTLLDYVSLGCDNRWTCVQYTCVSEEGGTVGPVYIRKGGGWGRGGIGGGWGHKRVSIVFRTTVIRYTKKILCLL